MDRLSSPDTHAFDRIAATGDSAFVILCDHAANALPRAYGDLGLPRAQLERHIAYDIGAAMVTRELARLMGAEALLTTFSRLLIDPNRGEDDPTLVMRLSDGAVVPGNARADAVEVARRLERFHRPYHDAIAATLDARQARGEVPLLVSVHSFTPSWRGHVRPWHAAALWDRDPRLALPLIAGLRADAGLIVGDNEPYDGALKGDTLNRHGTARGLPHVLIEIRQDLIADAAGAKGWAERLAGLLMPLAREAENRRVEHYGSRTAPGDDGLPAALMAGLEAEAFRRLTAHLRRRTDVRNIDLMTLAGFCRNCLSTWLAEAARARGIRLDKEAARRHVYGMPYDTWKALHQAEGDARGQRSGGGAPAGHVDDGHAA